jgi:ribosome-associated protein
MHYIHLAMTEPLFVRAGVVVPAEAFEMRAVRARGPGGQNVNKVASKVELRVDMTRIVGLDAEARTRLRALARSLLDAEGRLRVTSQRTRDQKRNLDDARDKLRALVLRALERPLKRRDTRPTRASVERRLRDKKRRSRLKSERGGEA